METLHLIQHGVLLKEDLKQKVEDRYVIKDADVFKMKNYSHISSSEK